MRARLLGAPRGLGLYRFASRLQGSWPGVSSLTGQPSQPSLAVAVAPALGFPMGFPLCYGFPPGFAVWPWMLVVHRKVKHGVGFTSFMFRCMQPGFMARICERCLAVMGFR